MTTVQWQICPDPCLIGLISTQPITTILFKASFHPSDNMRCYILRDTLSQAAKFTNKNSPYINHDLETRPKKSYVQLIAEALFSAPGGKVRLQIEFLVSIGVLRILSSMEFLGMHSD